MNFKASSFAPPIALKSPGIWKLAFADMDGDNKPDIVTTSYHTYALAFYRNTSTPGILSADAFADPVTIGSQFDYRSLKLSDLDNDGKNDVVAMSSDSIKVLTILQNRHPGDGSLINASSFNKLNTNFKAARTPTYISVTDLDGDARPDVFVNDIGDVLSQLFRNVSSPGQINLESAGVIENLNGMNVSNLGDLDNDGIPDIVGGGSFVPIYKNNAQGNTIPSITTFAPTSAPAATTIIIKGNNFSNVTGIFIGDKSVKNFKVNSISQISAEIPEGANGPLQVTTGNGTTTYGNFKLLVNPKIEYIGTTNLLVGTAISPLSPLNSGGSIPATSTWFTSTIAGNKSAISADGMGTMAGFNNPAGIVADTLGNLYVTELQGNRIRKIDLNGKVTTLAGIGTAGFTDGTTTSASFNKPAGITIDKHGNLLIADIGNAAIRKITPEGIVSTVARNVQTSSYNNSGSIALDSFGNMYVSDYDNDQIKKISSSGIVSNLAGTGYAGYINGNNSISALKGPAGLAISNSGNIIFADFENHMIRKVSTEGRVSTYAGSGFAGIIDGAASSASFNGPSNVCIGNFGTLYVTDRLNAAIREISADGVVTTIAGGGTPGSVNGIGTAASYTSPSAITTDKDENLFITEAGTHLVRKLIRTGYSIKPTLPAGLVIDRNTGVVSGTATESSPLKTYIITAKNEAGLHKTSITLKVDAPYPEIFTSKDSTQFIAQVNTNAVVIDNKIRISHAFKNTLPSVKISMANYNSADDILGFTSTPASGNISATFNTTLGLLELSSSGSLASIEQWNAALKAVTYSNLKPNPVAGTKTINFIANDGTLNSPTAQKTVCICYSNELKSLILSAGSLSPVFSPSVVNYSDTIANTINQITLNAIALDSNADISINGNLSTKGVNTSNLMVNHGNNNFTLMVKSQDGLSKKSYTVNVFRKKASQTISLASSKTVIYGAADFSINASSSNSLIPVNYSSSNVQVATVTQEGLIHIRGAGTVTITAWQNGNDSFDPAIPQSLALTVTPAIVIITANNQSKVYGAALPSLTAKYNGFVNGDDSTMIIKPVISTTALPSSPVGNYPINLNGAVSGNYSFVYQPAIITVKPATLTVTADNKSKNYGAANPLLTVTYTGFVNNDNTSKLTKPATATTIATSDSEAGNYPIIASGAESDNYSFVYNPGTLTILPLPYISSMWPSTAIMGDTITITGKNFTGVTSVSFGGTPAKSFTVISTTLIKAVVWGGSSGEIYIVNSAGLGYKSGFTYIPKPYILGSKSLTIMPGDNVTLTAIPSSGYTYQWFKDGAKINGANQSAYTAYKEGAYTVTIQADNIQQTSSPALLDVVPLNNIKISATAATCKGQSNGAIKISALRRFNYGYSVTLRDKNQKSLFLNFSDSLNIENLAAGTYELCTYVLGLDNSTQCFSVTIAEPKDLSVYISEVKNNNQITLSLDGGNTYLIELNGIVTSTIENQITLKLDNGRNSIKVYTDKECQAAITKEIMISEKLEVFPNPFEKILNIDLGNKQIKRSDIKIFDLKGQLVYSASFKNASGIIQLDLSNLISNVYVLSLLRDGSETLLKIIKK